MPFLLETKAAFLESDQVPAMCLFSGRIDQVQTATLPLRRPIQVPAAPGEYRRWKFCAWIGLAPLMVGLAAMLVILIGFTTPDGGAAAPLLAVACLVGGMLLTALCRPVAKRHCIRLQLADSSENLRIVFPASREHVFWEYLKAHKAWSQSQSSATNPALPVQPAAAPSANQPPAA